VALGPAQIHAQKHLGPVRRFGSACAGVDADDGVALVIRAGEEQAGSEPRVLAAERGEVGVQSGGHLDVLAVDGQLGQFAQVVGVLNQAVPGLDLLAQTLRRSQKLLGGALVGPEIGRAGLLVQIAQSRGLGF